ncbi:MAG: hypothetical protein HN348_02535 [Proteobacteria bacterium]|jgi:hypothetical protein|nr:hypothetical protein [Pseudomonadota bacterium]
MRILTLVLAVSFSGCFPAPVVDEPEGTVLPNVIGPEGGSVEVDGLMLEIPKEALAVDVSIVVTETDKWPPDPYAPLSHIWTFEPAGLVFAKPVTVSLPFEGTGDPSLFWSTADGDYERLDTTLNGTLAQGQITHFSSAFVAADTAETFDFVPASLDTLFVIDSSCSMAEEQEALTLSFPSLVASLEAAGIDWRVGTISMDMDDTDHSGKLQPASDGSLWVDATMKDPTAEFSTIATMGTSGSYDERGRASVYTAIEELGTTDNAGFVREDAQFAVAVVSDENDHSGDDPISLADFIDWMTLLKPSAEEVTFNSIVGPAVSCSGAVEEGADYLAVSNTVGGVIGSICDADYSTTLSRIENWLFWSEPMVLANVPDEVTLELTVTEADGTEVVLTSDEFAYQADRNAVRLQGYAAGAGATIKVRYTIE